MRKLPHRGLQLVGWMFTLAAAAYNMVRIRGHIRFGEIEKTRSKWEVRLPLSIDFPTGNLGVLRLAVQPRIAEAVARRCLLGSSSFNSSQSV